MRAFVVTVSPDDVEVASDVLWSLGVVAVEERGCGATVELWTSLGDQADGSEFTGAVAQLAGSDRWRWRFEDVDDAVVDTWREFAVPVTVAPGVVIRPAWYAEPLETNADIVIDIDPGSTFGMGDHPTTILSMRAMLGIVRPGDRVLDVGCGSGVLAIGAMRFGASHAVGIDIAPAAVAVTTDNAARNGVEVDVSTTPLADIDTSFDVVVANILAPVLIELADDLRRVTARTLIISGVLDGGFDHVLEALAPFEPVDVEVLDGWAAVTLRACSL